MQSAQKDKFTPLNRAVFENLSPDTSPEAERVQIELLRQAPTWRKLHLLAQMNNALRTLALSSLRERYPQAAPKELRRRLADVWLGPELAARVYGPPPYADIRPMGKE